VGIKQILLFVVGIVLVLTLFLYGRTRFPEGKSEAKQQTAQEGNKQKQLDFATLLSLAKKTLNADQLDSVTVLTEKMENTADDKLKEELLAKLSDTWLKTGNLIVSANYSEQLCAMAPTKKNWQETAEKYYLGMQNTDDTLARIFAADRAINSFGELMKMDSLNLNYKVSQALCYIDGKEDIMKGVVMLKEVEAKDPDNEAMNLTLGRLAIVSGQYDKAIDRLEKFVSHHADNAEALLHLGEAYRAAGKKEDAINAFEKCKQLLQNTEAKKQIDNLIHQIKNS